MIFSDLLSIIVLMSRNSHYLFACSPSCCYRERKLAKVSISKEDVALIVSLVLISEALSCQCLLNENAPSTGTERVDRIVCGNAVLCQTPHCAYKSQSSCDWQSYCACHPSHACHIGEVESARRAKA